MQIFAENRRFSQIHPFSWKSQHLEGAGNRRKPQIFAGNRRFSQKTAGNRRLGSVTLGPSPLARPYLWYLLISVACCGGLGDDKAVYKDLGLENWAHQHQGRHPHSAFPKPFDEHPSGSTCGELSPGKTNGSSSWVECGSASNCNLNFVN